MIVCSCNFIRCQDVRATIGPDGSGPRTPCQAYASLGCAAECGRCAVTIAALLRETRAVCATTCGPCAENEVACSVAVTFGDMARAYAPADAAAADSSPAETVAAA
jgi:bacterioferritin-associated ferredoxin